MNRLVVFGVAIFFAIVGIALLGGEKKAAAGHKCNGCSCDCGGDDGCNSCDCGGRKKKRHRRKNKCHADDCCGAPASCCAEPACAPACAPACEPACAPAPSCCGEVIVHEAAPAPAPAPEPAPAAEGAAPPPPPGAGTSIERGPMVYRQVSFRR